MRFIIWKKSCVLALKMGFWSFVNLESEKNNKSAEDLKRYAEFFKDRTSF
ncbi:hypothetical protein E5Q01_00630 [Helicobacter pylori]|nr:hypothetical protein E5Q01_00630 [Helicobacter pylori]